MGPISATFSRLYGPTGWIVLGAVGAVLFIVIFIQRKPSGLFAMKGRSAEA